MSTRRAAAKPRKTDITDKGGAKPIRGRGISIKIFGDKIRAPRKLSGGKKRRLSEKIVAFRDFSSCTATICNFALTRVKNEQFLHRTVGFCAFVTTVAWYLLLGF